MKKIKYFIYAGIGIVSSALLFSCSQEDSLGESRLDYSPIVKTELDYWLDEMFLDPYNIAVFYRANQYKTDMERYLTPPEVARVQPALEVVKTIWLEPYKEIAGEKFLKRIAPREILLVGSRNLNEGGTVTLGLAEQGYRITLFDVDGLDIDNEAAVKEYVHTIQHEYVHILNQSVRFDISAYETITPGGYRADWQNGTDLEALNLGFISKYSRSNSGEDFAEQASWMLRDIVQYEQRVNAVTNADGKAKIRMKEALVVMYYKDAFDIDFYELCRLTREKTFEVVNQ